LQTWASGRRAWLEICARYPAEWVALVQIDSLNENDLDFQAQVRSARRMIPSTVKTVLRRGRVLPIL